MPAVQAMGLDEYVLKGNATFIASAISLVVMMAAIGKPLAIVLAQTTKKVNRKKNEYTIRQVFVFDRKSILKCKIE